MKPLHVLVIVIFVVVAGGGSWLALALKPTQQAKPNASDFFEINPNYDTTGGQPMRPRLTD